MFVFPSHTRPADSGLFRSRFPPRLFTGMTLRRFGLSACTANPEDRAANAAAKPLGDIKSLGAVGKLPGLSKVPFVGAVITAGVAGSDVYHGHYASAAENVAGLGASTVAFEVGMAVLATNPAGWAVLGVGALAAGIGYAVANPTHVWHGIKDVAQGVDNFAKHPGHDLKNWAHDATSWL